MDKEKVWVLSWIYSDGSGYGVIESHYTKETAEQLLALLVKYGDSMKIYSINEVILKSNRSIFFSK